MKISEITSYLEQWAPLPYQESYDNCGLLIGNKDMEINGAMITLDVTGEVLEEAINSNCNFIISHHPLIFSGIKRINGNTDQERTILKAIKNDICIYAIHTNLDNVITGVNHKIAERIGLQNLHILLPKTEQLSKLVTFIPSSHVMKVREAIFEAGAGHIGNYDMCSFNVEGYGTFRGNEFSNAFVGEKGKVHHEPETRFEVIMPNHIQSQVVKAMKESHPYEEVAFDLYTLTNHDMNVGAGLTGELPVALALEDWLSHLKKSMNLKIIRHTKTYKDTIKKVAICGGAGSFLLKDAMRSGVDAFVTADFKYHEFFNGEGQLMICDIGHYESEIFTTELIRDKLLEKFPTFAARISTTPTNPVNYYY